MQHVRDDRPRRWQVQQSPDNGHSGWGDVGEQHRTQDEAMEQYGATDAPGNVRVVEFAATRYHHPPRTEWSLVGVVASR